MKEDPTRKKENYCLFYVCDVNDIIVLEAATIFGGGKKRCVWYETKCWNYSPCENCKVVKSKVVKLWKVKSKEKLWESIE